MALEKSEFGRLLREARERAGQSLGVTAKHLGISVAYLCDIEKGRRGPFAPERVAAVAVFLRCAAEPLLDAAATARGAFLLDADNVSDRARAVGAALQRSWRTLSDETLSQIERVIDGSSADRRNR